jgi:hypothetical protein
MSRVDVKRTLRIGGQEVTCGERGERGQTGYPAPFADGDKRSYAASIDEIGRGPGIKTPIPQPLTSTRLLSYKDIFIWLCPAKTTLMV